MRISDWSSDLCSSDLLPLAGKQRQADRDAGRHHVAIAIGAALVGDIETPVRPFRGACRCDICLGLPCSRYRCVQIGMLADCLTQGGRMDREIGESASDLRVPHARRSEEHTSDPLSLLRYSYAVFCLQKHKSTAQTKYNLTNHHNHLQYN